MEKQDHRVAGRELGIFAPDPILGSGLPMWLPAGAAVRAELERFIVDAERRAGFQLVYTPPLAKRELYERSGHWGHYADNMFPPMDVGAEQLVLRPMNCPHHARVYASRDWSYRDLPVRLAELGAMFRLERSGVVGGLSRVRCMTLNDAHVFCRPEQLAAEIAAFLAMVADAYDRLGIEADHNRLSLRGPGAKFVAGDAMWERAEAILREALDEAGVAFETAEGEGAFYGPKIDVQVLDHLGREETLSTVQVDFHLPERFGLRYRGSDGEWHAPALVHRSVVSTMERMVAHLLEAHPGGLPVWLAPVQVVVLPVADQSENFAEEVRRRAAEASLRAELRHAGETLPNRVRQAAVERVPYSLVVGPKEAASGSVSVRLRDGQVLPSMPVGEFLEKAAAVASARRASPDWP